MPVGFIFAAMAMMVLMQCSQHEKMVGKYQSVPDRSNNQKKVILELHPGGKGLWSIETDNAPFRWKINQNKISLHTRSGGVIEGSIHDGAIRIGLPGMGDILFKRLDQNAS